MRRILPYRTRDNHIEGVVVTFNDITELKERSRAVDEARLYAEAIVETVRQPLLVLDGEVSTPPDRKAGPAAAMNPRRSSCTKSRETRLRSGCTRK